MCQNCGYTGHSAKDCRYRIPNTSAYGSVPYNRQSTTENRDFRRDFRRAQNGHYPANEKTDHTPTDQGAEKSDTYYQQEYVDNSTNQPKNFRSHGIRTTTTTTMCARKTLITTPKTTKHRQLIIGRTRNLLLRLLTKRQPTGSILLTLSHNRQILHSKRQKTNNVQIKLPLRTTKRGPQHGKKTWQSSS